MKNTQYSIAEKLSQRLSELEDTMLEITITKQDKEKRMKRNEDSLRDLWYYIKCTNIRKIGVPKEEEKEKGSEKIFKEIIVKTSLTWEKK